MRPYGNPDSLDSLVPFNQGFHDTMPAVDRLAPLINNDRIRQVSLHNVLHVSSKADQPAFVREAHVPEIDESQRNFENRLIFYRFPEIGNPPLALVKTCFDNFMTVSGLPEPINRYSGPAIHPP